MTGESTTDEHIEESVLPQHQIDVDRDLKAILVDVLGLDSADVDEFEGETGLFGHLPELDSMAVAGLFTEIEDRFDMLIEDEDVEAEMLETYGGLLEFIVAKLADE